MSVTDRLPPWFVAIRFSEQVAPLTVHVRGVAVHERFDEQLAFDAPPVPAQVHVYGPLPDTADALPAAQRFDEGAVGVLPPFADPHWPATHVFTVTFTEDWVLPQEFVAVTVYVPPWLVVTLRVGDWLVDAKLPGPDQLQLDTPLPLPLRLSGLPAHTGFGFAEALAAVGAVPTVSVAAWLVPVEQLASTRTRNR